MVFQPDFELSRTVIDAKVEEYAGVFHADSRVKVEGAHVKLYCADYFGDKYFTDLGAFEQPGQEVARIQQLPVWQAAMNSFSAASMIRTAIAQTPKFRD